MRVVKVIVLGIFLIYNLTFNVLQEKETTRTTNVVSIGVVNLPENLLYLSDESYVNNVVVGNLFEGLVNLSSHGDVISGIAERCTVSEDGLIYKFYIRNDAYFSNGDLITSKDFLDFFKNIISKDEERFYYDDLKSIVGVQEFYDGKVAFDEVGIKVDKKDCLLIELAYRDESFLKNLTKDKFSLRSEFKYLYNYMDFYQYINYSGAYVIHNIYDSEDGNLKVILKPNKYYYLNNYKTVDEKLYSVGNDKEIILEVFSTREFALESYKSGKIKFVFDIAYSSMDDHFNSRDLYYVHNDISSLVFNLDKFSNGEKTAEVSMNLDEEHLDESQRLRKGNFMNFIVDTKDIRYVNGIDNEGLYKYVFDKEYIINKLQKYNFEDNKTLKIVTHSEDNYIQLARKFKEFLNAELDISINIIAFEDDYIQNSLKETEYDILISHFTQNSKGDILKFDKPNLILSSIGLDKNSIDGNGTIQINNLN